MMSQQYLAGVGATEAHYELCDDALDGVAGGFSLDDLKKVRGLAPEVTGALNAGKRAFNGIVKANLSIEDKISALIGVCANGALTASKKS